MIVRDQCTRCLEVMEADQDGNPILTGCRVRHPERLQETIFAGYTSDMCYSVLCHACNEYYDLRGRLSEHFKKSEAPISKGPKFCFEGFHTNSGCHELNEIKFLDVHPELMGFPKESQIYFREELKVRAANAILGSKALSAIRNHPRRRVTSSRKQY